MATVKSNRQSYNPQIDKSIDRKVIRHFQELYQASNDHDQAIIAVNTKVTDLQSLINSGAKTSTASSSSSSSSSSGGGSTPTTSFPNLGLVNPRTGVTAYTLQSSDSGVVVNLADAAPITISLNTSITAPFFCFISNFGPSTVTLSATSPQTVNGGATYDILSNQTCIVNFQGSQWYASAYPIVPVVLTGTSTSLGGGAMTAGQTVTVTVAVTGATTAMVASVSPVTYPGDGYVWDAYVSAADTVTVRLTATLAGTPTGSLYNVRVLG